MRMRGTHKAQSQLYETRVLCVINTAPISPLFTQCIIAKMQNKFLIKPVFLLVLFYFVFLLNLFLIILLYKN